MLLILIALLLWLTALPCTLYFNPDLVIELDHTPPMLLVDAP